MNLNYIHPQSKTPTSLFGALIALAIIIAVMGYTPLAIAQATPNIIVDLSTLEDGEKISGITNRGKLAIPPSRTPLSTLHIAPQKTPKLRPYTPLKKLKKIAPKLAKKKSTSPIVNSALSRTKKAQSPKVLVKEPLAPVPPKPSTSPLAKVTSTATPPPPPPPTLTPPSTPGPKVLKAPPAEPKAAKRPPSAGDDRKVLAAELAKTSPSGDIIPGRVFRIPFEGTNTRIPKVEKAKILTLADAVRGKEDLRLQLLAYAGGQNLSTSKTRRMSLSRALAVRSLLIVNGVRSTQIDIRALGSKTDEEPLNRVDLKLAKR